MSKQTIQEEIKPISLSFVSDDVNLVVISTIGDGNCYFHSILRAFNNHYINCKTVFERINRARSFRNLLADLLFEIDPITGKDYYSGLNYGKLDEISEGVKEYSREALRRELLSSQPVDNIYQELISNSINKDIYIIDGETMDMYSPGSAFSLYYKGRNSIVIFYTPGHFEVVGVKRSDGSINTTFTPEHKLIQACRERLLNEIRLDQKREVRVARTSPKSPNVRALSPKTR
jgi:hypothetical protein